VKRLLGRFCSELESPTWALDAIKLLMGGECGSSYKDVVQLFSQRLYYLDDAGIAIACSLQTGH